MPGENDLERKSNAVTFIIVHDATDAFKSEEERNVSWTEMNRIVD